MIQFPVLYEDNHLVAICKPQGIPAQQDASSDPDLLLLVKSYIKEKYSKPGNVYLGMVHRLNRPTGGVLVFARTSKAASRLSDQFRRRIPNKEYLAVVCGIPASQQAVLCGYLLKDHSRNTVTITDKNCTGAKEGRLSYSVQQTGVNLSLLRIKLETGRSHQIRVQLAAAGLPVRGDHRYGDRRWNQGEDLAPWATSLRLQHPVGGKEAHFFVPSCDASLDRIQNA